MRIVAGAWRGHTLVAPPGQGTRPTADRTRQALFDMLMHAEWGGKQVVEGASVLDVFAGTGALGLEALSRGAGTVCFIEKDASALRALRTNVAACKAEDRTEILAVDVFAAAFRSSIAVRSPRGRKQAVSLQGDQRGSEHSDRVRRFCGAVSEPVEPGHDDLEARINAKSYDGQDRNAHAGIERHGKRGGAAPPASLVFFDPPYGQDLVSRALARLRQAGQISPGALVIAEIGRDEAWRPEQPLLAERQHGAARILIFRANGQ